MVTPHPARATLSQGVLFSEAIIMSESALIGIDLGKHSFHLHGQTSRARGVSQEVLAPQMMQFFGNLPSCTVVMEACAGAHFVARQLTAWGIRPS
jgi:transposase